MGVFVNKDKILLLFTRCALMRPICLILPIFKNYFLLPGVETEAKISNHNTSATTTRTTTTAAAATAE